LEKISYSGRAVLIGLLEDTRLTYSSAFIDFTHFIARPLPRACPAGLGFLNLR
jgi:hypothetical protein